MGYKGDSYMDCGYFCVSPVTGRLEYYPPPNCTVSQDGELTKKKIKGFAEYRNIEDEPFEPSKGEKEDMGR